MLIRIPILCLLLLLTATKLCTQPQRSGVMSFSGLSSRDHIFKVFYAIDKKMSTYNVSAVNDSVTYTVTNMKPQFYYIDNTELNQFVDSLTANVTSGKLYLAAFFNYSYVGGSGQQVKGYGVLKVLLDPFSFLKQLQTINGYLEWDPIQIDDITMHSLFVIEETTPKLENSIRRTFETILNDQMPTPNGVKDAILAQMNTLFKAELKSQLNSQNIMNNGNITYNYKGTKMTFTNQIYHLSLYNDDDFKGLKYSYLFQLQGYTRACNILPFNPDPTLGGVQQLLSMQTLRATFFFGLQNGLFDTQLGPSWQSQIFQFYAGDVSNVIANLSNQNPTAPITGDCKYNSSLIGANLLYQGTNSIVAVVPYRCRILINNSTLVQTVTFNATFDVDLYARNQTIRAVIDNAFLSTVKFYDESAEQKYNATDTAVGAYYILSVLRTNQGRETFGTGFPTLFRKYPQLKVTPNYTVIYDPSQQ